MSNNRFKVGVAGAGVMGSGITQVMALAGCEVSCCDIDDEVINVALTLSLIHI